MNQTWKTARRNEYEREKQKLDNVFCLSDVISSPCLLFFLAHFNFPLLHKLLHREIIFPAKKASAILSTFFFNGEASVFLATGSPQWRKETNNLSTTESHPQPEKGPETADWESPTWIPLVIDLVCSKLTNWAKWRPTQVYHYLLFFGQYVVSREFTVKNYEWLKSC